eukprot:66064_1
MLTHNLQSDLQYSLPIHSRLFARFIVHQYLLTQYLIDPTQPMDSLLSMATFLFISLLHCVYSMDPNPLIVLPKDGMDTAKDMNDDNAQKGEWYSKESYYVSIINSSLIVVFALILVMIVFCYVIRSKLTSKEDEAPLYDDKTNLNIDEETSINLKDFKYHSFDLI